mgnify:CR=1 FL=1
MWSWVRKYWLLCGLVLLGECVVGGLFFFWVDRARNPDMASEVPEIQARVVYEGIEILVVNPSGTSGLRYLMIQPILLVESQEVVEELEAQHRRSCVRDSLVRMVSRRQIDELDDPEEIDGLKQDMVQTLNHMLEKGKVVDVCFKTFIWQ